VKNYQTFLYTSFYPGSFLAIREMLAEKAEVHFWTKSEAENAEQITEQLWAASMRGIGCRAIIMS
jgi:hypothetical protein